jgi:multiple sugar transport system substrate-binding protein
MRPGSRARLGFASVLIACLTLALTRIHPAHGRASHPEALNGRPALSSMSADQVAVQAAQKYRGLTLNVNWEQGLQEFDPELFSGPLWTKLTGIKIHVVAVPHVDLYNKAIAEHVAGSGAYDVLNFAPSWTADFVNDGVVEPLDSYVKKYYPPADFQDYLPLYHNIVLYSGHRYGLFDDGDTLILYYRTDLFNDPKNKTMFQKAYGYPLAVPVTMKQFQDIADFFTKHSAPKMYGYAAPYTADNGAWYYFDAWLRVNGGEFYDPKTMKAMINSPAGVKTLQEMVAQTKDFPPGALNWNPVQLFTAWMGGHLAMTSFWPPLGRWSAGYRAVAQAKQLSFLPKNVIKGKVGYAIMPGGHGEMASGFDLGVSADSKHKEAAYLFVQWMTSPKISLQRVELPYTLRDPYRISHIDAPSYRHLWPQAPQYLDTLAKAGQTALLDNFLPGGAQYDDALGRAIFSAFTGADPKMALDGAARKWDAITQRLGVAKQHAAYLSYLKIPGSQVSNTFVH